jgi:hypothetical protein
MGHVNAARIPPSQSRDSSLCEAPGSTLTYYVEVNDTIVYHRKTWAAAVQAATEEQAFPGRQIIIWGSDGSPYVDWARTSNPVFKL